MTSLRVLHSDPSLFTAPYDRALASALARGGAEVELFGRPLRRGECSFDDEPFSFVAGAYRLSEGPFAAAPTVVRLAIKALEHGAAMATLERRVRRERPDLVHLQWLPWPRLDRVMVERLRRLVPVVLTVHDSVPVQRAASFSLAVPSRPEWRRADALVIHTEAGAERLRAAGATQILQVPHPPLALPPGLVVDPFDPPVRTVVMVGEIKPYKGLDVLLEALGRVAGNTGIRLVVAGRARMEVGSLVRRCEVLGLADRVEWRLGRLDEEELRTLLAAADAFVLPYRHADASGVLSLVLPLGRPIVASRVGAMGEVIEDRESGLLVAPGDVEALAAALVQLGDPMVTRRLASGALGAVERLGTWRQVAASHLELYRRLLALRGRSRHLAGLADRNGDRQPQQQP